MIGNAGAPTGTRMVRPKPLYEDEVLIEDGSTALPSACLQHFTSPGFFACDAACEGRQDDGGCLVQIIHEANAKGARWKFSVNPRDGSWHYDGEPL